MKAEQAKKVADQALEQLAEALAKGRSEELTRYLSMLAKFHKYSFGNVMLILSQKPDATMVGCHSPMVHFFCRLLSGDPAVGWGNG
ncbi:MAG: hypothetical protein AMXMBFR20_26080 [Planctomycetia bacterium]